MSGNFLNISVLAIALICKSFSGYAQDDLNFQQLIKEGQLTGEINKTLSPLATARHLYNCLVGLKIIAQTCNDKKTLEDIAKVSLSILQK